MLVLLALLAISTTDEVIPEPELVWRAPPALSMERGPDVPKAVVQSGGVFLPTGLDDFVLARLAAYEQYPAQCQVRLDNARKVAEAQLRIALTTDDAEDAERDAGLLGEIAARWPAWGVVAMVTGGVLFGGGVMWLAATAVR